MTIYVITEKRTQSTFIDKFGEEAEPIVKVLGVRPTKESAQGFKKRMNQMIQEEAYVEGTTETITLEIQAFEMPE